MYRLQCTVDNLVLLKFDRVAFGSDRDVFCGVCVAPDDSPDITRHRQVLVQQCILLCIRNLERHCRYLLGGDCTRTGNYNSASLGTGYQREKKR